MADIKPSELNQTAQVNDTDILAKSTDQGGGSYESEGVQAQYLVPIKGAENVGTSSVGWLKGITGRIAQFLKPKAGSTKISIARVTDDIVFDVVEAQIIHDNLSGGMSLVAHGTTSAVVGINDTQTLTGKTIDANNNTIINIGNSEVSSDIITGQTIKATPVGADSILIVDSESGNVLKKALINSLPQNVGIVDINNIGTAGEGIFKQIVGSLAEFYKLNPVSSKISIVLDGSNNKIDFDIVESNIVHQNVSGAGTNTHAQIDTHISDSTIHFTEASINHANIQNVGTNSHAEIDSHIAASSDVHGVSGGIVGATQPQTLTGKTIDVDLNTILNINNILPYRRQSVVAANGGIGQVINYSTPLTGAGRPFIEDYNGLGIYVTAYDDDGFTIDSLSSGDFGYEVRIDK
jgi:hypothetical protein